MLVLARRWHTLKILLQSIAEKVEEKEKPSFGGFLRLSPACFFPPETFTFANQKKLQTGRPRRICLIYSGRFLAKLILFGEFFAAPSIIPKMPEWQKT